MNKFAKDIMEHKYSHTKDDGTKESWDEIAYRVTKHVMAAVGVTMRDKLAKDICKAIQERKFMPGGRYLYAAGRPFHQVQNCLLMRAEDSREGWAQLMKHVTMGLMTGAGVGVDYSAIRGEGKPIRKTGGVATGPCALMQMVNEAGRGIMQGGSRRCLPGDTLVRLADNTQCPINHLNVKDVVATRFGPKKVVTIEGNGIKSIFVIVTEHGRVRSTGNHRWLVSALKSTTSKWIQTKHIKVDDYLLYAPPRRKDCSQPIRSKILEIYEDGKEWVYDIEVEDVHEFFADNFVSHNSALWAGLKWSHTDIHKFISLKNWTSEVRKLKEKDFNFPATLDGTNISVQLDDLFFEAFQDDNHILHASARDVYLSTVRQMLKTGEPGFSIDTGCNAAETLANACTEVRSADDSDICNLGSLNFARISSLAELQELVSISIAFLLAGTVYSDVPYAKVDQIRTKNRRLGLGVMGLHEWLLMREKSYGPDAELGCWLHAYAQNADQAAQYYAECWELSVPVKNRAVAPTGSIGILAETTTGIEPIFCVAYKRRYLKHSTWHYQYVVDPTARRLIENHGVDPNSIQDSYSLADNIEKRVEFQAWVQQYVDHAISSTINLPAWGSEQNNDNKVLEFGNMLMKYLPKLRGITVYPDGARGGQPLVPVKYQTAIKHAGQELVEEAVDVCEITGKGGSCGS